MTGVAAGAAWEYAGVLVELAERARSSSTGSVSTFGKTPAGAGRTQSFGRSPPRKLFGISRFGTGSPALIACTISGVTSTNSSPLFLVIDFDWNSFPRIGTFAMPGIRSNDSVVLRIQESRNYEALSIFKFHLRLNAPCR